MLVLGPIVLLLGGILMGITGLHSSTDNWIAIATGRYIVQNGHVPTTDPFSYTFQGKPFFNQNWLSHVIFYLLYDRVEPNAIVYFTWSMNLTIFALIAIAAWWRTGSWFAALFATGVIAACARHMYDTRPQSVGYVCFAILCLLLQYYSRPRARENLWAAGLLFPLLWFWGNAHGSFVLAYGLVIFFVGAWLLTQLLGKAGFGLLRVPVTFREAAAMTVATLAAFIITWATGPYGFLNFKHSFVVQESPIWKQVAEWNPPWVIANAGLPVIGQWAAFGVAGAALALGLALELVASRPDVRRGRWSQAAWLGIVVGLAMAGLAAALALAIPRDDWFALQKPPIMRGFWALLFGGLAVFALGVVLHCAESSETDRDPAAAPAPPPRGGLSPVTLFDVIVFLVGLFFSLQSRRFSALLFILAGPPFVLWVCTLAARVELDVRRIGRLGLAALAALGGLVVGAYGANWAWEDLVLAYREPPADVALSPRVRAEAHERANLNLLERWTQYYETNPTNGIAFLAQFTEPVNVFAQWTVSGVLFARAPMARAFMDGRAQQVYSEAHYMLFNSMFGNPNAKGDAILRLLEQYDTEIILLRASRDVATIIDAAYVDPKWLLLYYEPREVMYVRRGTPAFEQVRRLERAGTLVWPEDAMAYMSRATLALEEPTPNFNRAIELLRKSAELEMLNAPQAYAALTKLWRQLGRGAEALQYFTAERQRVASLSVAPEYQDRRKQVLNVLDGYIQQFGAQPH